jgi:hypothetical protein
MEERREVPVDEWVRIRICPHLYGCPQGDSCSLAPCSECGALCPNSSWTPTAARENIRYERQQLVNAEIELARTIALHESWATKQ